MEAADVQLCERASIPFQRLRSSPLSFLRCSTCCFLSTAFFPFISTVNLFTFSYSCTSLTQHLFCLCPSISFFLQRFFPLLPVTLVIIPIFQLLFFFFFFWDTPLELIDWKDHQKAFVLHYSNLPLSFLFALFRVHLKRISFFFSSCVASQNLLAQCKRAQILIQFPLMALKMSLLCYSTWPASLSFLFSGPLCFYAYGADIQHHLPQLMTESLLFSQPHFL